MKELKNIFDRLMDGRYLAILTKAEGLAFITADPIYSASIQKLIDTLNERMPQQMEHFLIPNLWQMKISPKEAYEHVFDRVAKEIVESREPLPFVMEIRMFYQS